MNAVAAGEDPKGGIRDPAVNPAIQLPVISRQELTEGYTLSELMANAALQRVHMRHRLQYGQPEAVARAYEAAMGFTLETAGFVETKPAK
jgi:5,5'-dehydrodivanillate O-demethylase